MSNHHLLNRELRFDPRGAWKLVAKTGRFAHHEHTAPSSGAVSAGEISLFVSRSGQNGMTFDREAMFQSIRQWFIEHPGWE